VLYFISWSVQDEVGCLELKFSYHFARFLAYEKFYCMVTEELKRGSLEQSRLMADVKRLSSELDEAKSQLVVAGFRMESDLQDEKRKCQEEIASLQQIVQGIMHYRLPIEIIILIGDLLVGLKSAQLCSLCATIDTLT
jgi:hypothetical protein